MLQVLRPPKAVYFNSAIPASFNLFWPGNRRPNLFNYKYYIRCWRATAELAKGKTAEKTGYITKIQKNNYSIADTLPLTSSKRPKYSKPAGFHIPPSRCSGNFKPGDKITIIYARSRELNIYDRLHLAAICAFPCPTEPNDNHKKAS